MTPGQTSVTRRLRLSTDISLRRRFMVIDEPVAANIRVGLLLEVLDKLAEETAIKYARRGCPAARVVTAAMDDLKVCGPPDIERDIVLRARVNYVGKIAAVITAHIEMRTEDNIAAGMSA